MVLLSEECLYLQREKSKIAKRDIAILVGRQIKSKRIDLGMTLQELSNITGISQPHLSRIEKGKMNVTIETIACISAALNAHVII